MKLKVDNMKEKNDKIVEKNCLNLLDISIEVSEEEEISCSDGLSFYS